MCFENRHIYFLKNPIWQSLSLKDESNPFTFNWKQIFLILFLSFYLMHIIYIMLFFLPPPLSFGGLIKVLLIVYLFLIKFRGSITFPHSSRYFTLPFCLFLLNHFFLCYQYENKVPIISLHGSVLFSLCPLSPLKCFHFPTCFSGETLRKLPLPFSTCSFLPSQGFMRLFNTFRLF